MTLVVARQLMPRLLEAVAKACSPEVFLLTVIALCLGTAYLTALAGVSVSLGAFLAGLVVSESRHSTHALGEVLPLQVLFSAVFFLSVGTLLDVRFLAEEPLLVLGTIALVLVVKTVTTTVAARAVGVPLATALSVGLLLAQVGEFAFVLQRIGADEGLTPADLGPRGSQAFLAATVVLLVASPVLAAAGRRTETGMGRRAVRRPSAAAPPAPVGEQAGHVLVSGWGSGARAVVDVLRAEDHGVLVTLNPDGASEAEVMGMQVVLGDSTKEHVLREAGVTTARLVVVADDEPEQAARIVLAVRRLAPAARIVVRTRERGRPGRPRRGGCGPRRHGGARGPEGARGGGDRRPAARATAGPYGRRHQPGRRLPARPGVGLRARGGGPAGRADRPGLRRVLRHRRDAGSTCGSARPAVTSAAATPRRAGTRRRTPPTTSTRSWCPSSRGTTGAGATSTARCSHPTASGGPPRPEAGQPRSVCSSPRRDRLPAARSRSARVSSWSAGGMGAPAVRVAFPGGPTTLACRSHPVLRSRRCSRTAVDDAGGRAAVGS